MKLTAIWVFAVFLVATVATLRADQLSEEEAEDIMARLMRSKKDVTKEEAARAFFKIFDTDGDGYITTKELHNILKRAIPDLPEQEVEKVIQTLDINKDGKISIDEVVKMATA